MIYTFGSKIISKKQHACGSNKWEIVRVGADIKLKCLKCGHCIFCTHEEVKKMTKKLLDNKGSEEN